MSSHPQARGLPVGWTIEAATPIGFGPPDAPRPGRSLLRHAGEGHLLTVAPTGAGKGRSGVIPTLLTYPGPTLTIDMKGECYHVTARARRRMGHRVVVLDPFRVATPDPDTLNPLDLLALPGGEAGADSEMLAELLLGGMTITSKDVFWELSAKGMLTGLIGYAAEHPDPAKRTLPAALDLLYADDVDYGIAVILDTHKFRHPAVRQELTMYLQHEGEKCRAGVRSTAQAMVKCLGSQAVRTALSRTSFDLGAWHRGEPTDIYFVMPPDKLVSHRAVMRLTVGTLLTALMRRAVMPAERTLLLLDECAQLGSLSQLATALTLLRGYGVQVWTFWQDLSQLKALYPTEWEAVLNNSAVIQAYGATNAWAARATAEVFGVPVSHVLRLGAADQMLTRLGAGTETTRRVDYLTDPAFAGLYDPNPRYRPGVDK